MLAVREPFNGSEVAPMGFANDRQIAACCIALCKSVRMEDAWTLDGPTELGCAINEGKTGHSSGEILIVRVAFGLWNGGDRATFGRVCNVLDDTRLRMVGSLLVAIVDGPKAVDAWLSKHGDARMVA